jgi:tetratricopeptide (TPR) repeat protein
MYTLCEARMSQGNRELAEKTAQRASKISGDRQEDHAQLAQRLSENGLPRWSDREWRQVITLGPMGTKWDIYARTVLANSLHDRQLDSEAAELLGQLLDAVEKEPDIARRIRAAQQQIEASLGGLRSSRDYYLACHAHSQGDAAGRRELLKKALDEDDKNVEVLIGLYQATADDAEARAVLMELIDRTIETCRGAIEDSPEEPTYYNEIAWLVANTEGDFDEAVELSQKSVELAGAAGDAPPRLGGLLDTLAHCYYAKKDYANAVKTQEEAVKLDPHTQSIRRALARFREALSERQAGGA